MNAFLCTNLLSEELTYKTGFPDTWFPDYRSPLQLFLLGRNPLFFKRGHDGVPANKGILRMPGFSTQME